MGKFIDISGLKFHRLLVLERTPRKGSSAYWLCRCDCGNIKEVRGSELKDGNTKSCGCFSKDYHRDKNLKHGYAKKQNRHPMYESWKSMLQRCENPKATRYDRYGGRGISVCDRWHDFSQFEKDMAKTWNKGLTLERIDNNANYEPSNCRWATRSEQLCNTNRTVFLTAHGLIMSLTEWARCLGVNPKAFNTRKRLGWSDKKIIDTPINYNLSHK